MGKCSWFRLDLETILYGTEQWEKKVRWMSISALFGLLSDLFFSSVMDVCMVRGKKAQGTKAHE